MDVGGEAGDVLGRAHLQIEGGHGNAAVVLPRLHQPGKSLRVPRAGFVVAVVDIGEVFHGGRVDPSGARPGNVVHELVGVPAAGEETGDDLPRFGAIGELD